MAVAKIDGVADDAGTRVATVAARHERTLLRVARQASLCHDDALDAYQRALEIFVRRVDSVDRATELAWLKVVVRHEAIAIRRARTDTVSGEDVDVDALVARDERAVEEKVASEERVRRSAEALRSLKPDEAKALMMKAHGLSYEEIGARNGWSYTKVNRAITEGRRRFLAAYEGIEAGAACERFAPIVDALSTRTATSAQILQIRPHLRHCSACRAAVRDMHLSRLRRATLFWPLFGVVERVTGVRHEAAAVFHRAQASDLATSAGVTAGSGGGGRIATVGAIVGLCLGGASVGTVCVVSGVPDFGSRDAPRPAARAERPPRSAARPAPSPAPVASTATIIARPATRVSPPQARSRPSRARAASRTRTRTRPRPRAPVEEKDAAPREFGFEQQAPAPEPAVTTAQSQPSEPPPAEPVSAPAPSNPPSQTQFSPADQEFAP